MLLVMSNRSANRSPAVPLSAVESTFGLSLDVARRRHARLTRREAQVARWMATGRPNPQIADELRISPKTLDIHRANVKAKLEAPTTAAVANLVNLLRLAEVAEGPSEFGRPDRTEVEALPPRAVPSGDGAEAG
jgi:DNA-binding CsgD family transcriptional regulator